MKTHVTVLAWLHLAMAIPTLLIGAICMFGVTALGLGDLHSLPLFGALGAGIGVLFLLVAIPSLLVGIGLLQLKPWARILGIVASIFDLFSAHTFGFGTALGIYGLIILFNPETVQMFERR